MFLATTALTEFWDKDQELLYLGLWCLPRAKMPQWQGARGKVMPSPWDETGRTDMLVRHCTEGVQERLVDFLGERLNELLGVTRTPRYWRILLRPWALAHIAVVADHWLHLDAALRLHPEMATIGLDPQDFRVPRDTDDHRRKLSTDVYHLQLYSELMTAMRRSFPVRRAPAGVDWGQGPAAVKGWAGAAREVLRGAARVLRMSEFADVYFSGLGLDARETAGLVKLSKGKLWPVAEALPEGWTVAPDMSRRLRLADFPVHDEVDRLIALTLPTHLPTLFLEGYHRWR